MESSLGLNGLKPLLDTQTNENEDEKVLKEFECPICLNYAAPPIMMCKSSHIVCKACWGKCYSCPTCRAPKTLTRALILENIYPLLTFPCKYDGCSFKGNGAFTPFHEQTCMFFPIMCPLKRAFDCTWRGPVGYTKKHLLETHKANVYLEPNVRLVSRNLNSCNKKSYSVIFCCYGKMFRFTLEYDRSLSSDVQFSMVQIGCRNRHEVFQYTLRFFNKFPISQRNHGFIATKADISKDFSELVEMSQMQNTHNAKLRLHFNHLLAYCTKENGDFYYEVGLQKSHYDFKKPSFNKCHINVYR